jgi:two-component system, chemotaxis family, sensor kinase Cph1
MGLSAPDFAGGRESCDREPIHIPGTIQPHGVLLSVDPRDWTIAQVSANSAALLSEPPEALVGQPLSHLLAAETMTELADRDLTPVFPHLYDPVPIFHRISPDRALYCIAHRHDGRIIMEFEELGEASAHAEDLHRKLSYGVGRIARSGSDVASICDVAAMEMHELTGFDRTMVYRFDHDWHGEVIAEQTTSLPKLYLGHHFPASDIPAQARALYTRTLLRVIPDVDGVSVPLVPQLDPVRDQPLDLTHAALRSVSPIHLQYLRNMEVRASMSLSLLVGNRLWGMIVCHHACPRMVSAPMRGACQELAEVVATRLFRMEAEQRASGFLQARTRADTLADALSDTPDLAAGIERRAPMLLTWFGCTALLGRIHSKPIRHGTQADPPTTLPVRLGADPVRLEDAWASTADPVGVYLSGDARADFTGAVHLPLSPDGSEYLVLGRPEQTRTVVWAGGPPTPGAGEEDLTPRASFAAWLENVSGRSLPFDDVDHQLAVEIRRRLIDRLLLDDRRNRALELERRVAERTRELAEARAAAERASNAKTRFLAAASHDLRQPLQAGVIFHSVLSRRNQDPRQAEVIEQLGRSLEVLQGLLEGMLDISRIDAGIVAPERQVFPVQSILDQLMVEFAPAAERRQLALRAKASTAQVYSDRNLLYRILHNLVANAIQFTDSGRVVLGCRLGGGGSLVRILVCDTGRGIPPDMTEAIFEEFMQLSNPARNRHLGLGLGLAVVERLSGLLGHRIAVRSIPERGSIFEVAVPRVTAEGVTGEAMGKTGAISPESGGD